MYCLEGQAGSLTLLNFVRECKVTAYVSILTSAIIYFVRSKSSSPKIAREDISKSTRQFNAVSLTPEIVDSALIEERIQDFEDAIQFHSCKTAAGILITRNKRDFANAKTDVDVLTPEEFLNRYGI
jgi:hypothetical protein